MRRAMSIHSVAKSWQVLLFAGARRLIGIVRLALLGVQCGVTCQSRGMVCVVLRVGRRRKPPTTSRESGVFSCRYWTAVSRGRRGRKCGDIPLNTDGNATSPGEVNLFIFRCRCLLGVVGSVVQRLRSTVHHAGIKSMGHPHSRLVCR